MASKQCPQQKEKARRQEYLNKLYEAKKLILVLDLDQTLVDTTKFSNNLKDKEKLENTEISARHLIYRLGNSQYWLKLRPGIWNFLHKASKLFELHVNTMAGIIYAKEVVSILDPTGALFEGRVTATDWGEWREFKTLDARMGFDSATLIVDDTESVWPCNEKNLIHAKGYKYFRSKKSNKGHSSSFEIDPDESAVHGTLAEILALLERVHREFFAQPNLEKADVRKILEKQQRNVLSWCWIFFSGIIPKREANPHLHPLWQLAEKFGAVCCDEMYDEVTHVIMKSSNGADKEVIDWALSNGKFVVTVEWLQTSAWLCRRADEKKFAVKQAKQDQKSKGKC